MNNEEQDIRIEGFSFQNEPIIPDTTPVMKEGEELLDLGDDFDFKDYQVVRREFFAHLSEPSISFNNLKFYVNAACLSKFPNVDYAQVMVDSEKKLLALRPCDESAKDSFPWCMTSKGKRKPKQITCKLFFAKVVSLMGWNPNYRYKMLGKVIHANGMYLLAFDLTATEVYQRTMIEGEKPKTSRTPVFPAEWKNQFGLPYYEHEQALQINVFQGYAIYEIRDNKVPIKHTSDDSSSLDLPPAITSAGGDL